MGVFSPSNIAKAISRIPGTDTKTLTTWVDRGRREGLDDLVAACECELALRPIDLTTQQAKAHALWSEETRAMSLTAAIEYAFRVLPVRDYERALIREIAENPGIAYPDLVANYGNRDAALVMGHCVYERFGCFRQWVEPGKRMSDILFQRDESGPHVRYRLAEAAQAGLAKLGIA